MNRQTQSIHNNNDTKPITIRNVLQEDIRKLRLLAAKQEVNMANALHLLISVYEKKNGKLQ